MQAVLDMLNLRSWGWEGDQAKLSPTGPGTLVLGVGPAAREKGFAGSLGPLRAAKTGTPLGGRHSNRDLLFRILEAVGAEESGQGREDPSSVLAYSTLLAEAATQHLPLSLNNHISCVLGGGCICKDPVSI